MNTSQRKSQSSISLSQRKSQLGPLPVYGGDRQRAIEESIRDSNILLEQIKLTQWQKSFVYVPIPTNQFKSIFLETNQHFQVCLNIIKEFNEEVERSRKDNSEIRNGPWKQKFNNQLQLLLREIVFTKDRIIQKNFCEKVCSWAVDQLTQLEVAAETQMYETMESLHAKVSLSRPESALSAMANSSNFLGSRIQSASSTTIGRRPKSGVLRTLDKSLLPQLNTTQSTMRPESAFNSTLRPDSAAYYSKVDMIRPESSKNFKKIRPGSAVTFNTKILRPVSSILRPESAFIKEDNEEDEVDKLKVIKEKEGDVINEIDEGDNLDREIELKLQQEFGDKEELKRKQQRERIRVDQRSKKLQPSEQIQQLLEDYKTKARTQIDGVEPPAERLTQYIRKKLVPENLVSSNEDENKEKKKDISDDYSNLNWAFPKPEIYLPSQQQPLDPPIEEIPQISQVPLISSPPQEGQAGLPAGAPPPAVQGEAEPVQGDEEKGAEVKADKGDEKEKKEVNIIPDIKNFTIDANSKETFVRNLNGKFEQRSTYINYEPSNDVREMRMEKRWEYNRNKELSDKRSDEERIAIIKDWSIAKGRLEKEINRKIDSSVYGSQFVACDYKPRPYTAKELREIDKNTLPTRKLNNFFKDDGEGVDQRSQAELQGSSIIRSPEQEMYMREEEENEEEMNHQEVNIQDKSLFQFFIKESGEEGGEEEEGEGGDQHFKDFFQDEQEEDLMEEIDGVPKVGEYRGSRVNIGKHTNVIDGTKNTYALAKTDKYLRDNQEIEDLEYQASKQKIMQIRQLYGATINVARSKELEDERPDIKNASLSVYSKDRRKLITRPFSAVITRVNVDTVRREEIDEIEEVKRRLAKYNLSVPLKALKSALLVPEGNLGVEADLLPEPGQGLFSNPFIKTKKKKKKKGKKKSKK